MVYIWHVLKLTNRTSKVHETGKKAELASALILQSMDKVLK